MIESFVRVIAQQDAHDAGNDGKDTRLGRELLVGRLGNGCRVHHEKARDSYHEQLAADFLLDAFRGLRVKLPLRKVVALHRLVELFDLPSQMVGLPHHEACDPTPYGPNLSSKLPSFREWVGFRAWVGSSCLPEPPGRQCTWPALSSLALTVTCAAIAFACSDARIR